VIFVIIVTAFPTFTTTVASEMNVQLMEDVRFTCQGMGEPEVTYEWLYTNSSGKFW